MEENMGVSVSKLYKKMNFECLTREINTDDIMIEHAEINRPALQLTGFYDYFDHERVQIIGMVENAYMETLSKEERLQMYDRLFSCRMPCFQYLCGTFYRPRQYMNQSIRF